MTRPAPIIAAVLLLLLMSVLYVGSYLALLFRSGPLGDPFQFRGGQVAARVFWPLEEIERRVRPDDWGPRIRLSPINQRGRRKP